jgi:hypothetical protein
MNGVGGVIRRLEDCKTLSELQTRWAGIAKAYQVVDEIAAAKDRMKAALS